MTTVPNFPALPILPEYDALLDDHELSEQFAGAVFAAAHCFAASTIRRRRDFAGAYTAAIHHYLQTVTNCDAFGDIEREIADGVHASVMERSRRIESRNAARRELKRLSRDLPLSVHAAIVSYSILGGQCQPLLACGCGAPVTASQPEVTGYTVRYVCTACGKLLPQTEV